MERFGLTRSMSAKGCRRTNAAAEGFFGRMKTEAVYPEKWEEHTRNECSPWSMSTYAGTTTSASNSRLVG